jgi:hypothetical protein
MVVFLGEEFIAVLEQTDDGVAGAFTPFKVVAAVSAVSTVAGLLGALVYPVALSRFQAVLLAVGTGGVAASVAGIVQLVAISAFFGTERFKLLSGMREAENARAKRLRDPAQKAG